MNYYLINKRVMKGEPMSKEPFVTTNDKEYAEFIGDELADIMIRVMDLAAFKGIDLEKHIDLKMKYNSLRPHKHGKKY